MLEIVREYSLERLSGSDEADETRRGISTFVSLAEEAEPSWPTATRSPGLTARDEHDNLRSALAFALDSDDSSSACGSRSGYAGSGKSTAISSRAVRLWSRARRRARCSVGARASALNMCGILAGEQGEFDAAA